MAGTNVESNQTYKCRYCGKEFRKESTLAAHACEQKRRYQQQNDTGVQFGFRSYLRFYEVTQGSAKLKTYDDFAASPYYNAFVKYGRYCVSIRCVNVTNFTDWLLKNNKKLDHWSKDSLYEEWLLEYLRRENYKDALERGVKEMQDYADENPDLKNGLADYFRYGNTNRICHHICTGRITPWIIYNCNSGIECLDTLNAVQLEMIVPWIDPDYWSKKFTDYSADQMHTKEILTAAGL
jgi:hypothetical protein